MTRLQRFLGSVLGAFLSSCAGSGTASDTPEPELLVILHDFKAGERFELASESHTDRVAYYSGERSDAARKVQTDEVMSAFLRQLDELGLGQHARAGRAPAIGSGDVIRWGLEVESADSRVHWLVGTGSPASDWKEFQACRDTFLELYNYTVSYQAVRNESGRQYLDERAPAAAGQKKR
jgi:hypothetical protein